MPSCHGKYKTIGFRSLLELSYLKWLELQGLILNHDVLYETIRIPYSIGNGRARDYIPDFFVKPWNMIVELKHSARQSGRMNEAKFEAAHRFCYNKGLCFVVLTEKDISPLSLSTLAEDLSIKWSPGTLKRKRFAKKIKEARKR